ncbi:hypothetical protein [Glycomyces paridis]|uniref:Lipoprotein n=1 Tax=Glycomyces paridis TaxID=2126555 RepID=A0A4S8PBB2_9ACTN|nr:hypothetical protein [Glycomyces paridis]THV26805.1 hypothetical protein E9998_17625 [Glycomyces paridis]
MRRTSAFTAAAALVALTACAPSEPEERYWTEGEDPVLVHGTEPQGYPDILEVPGVLRYERGCFFVEVADGDPALKTVVWHMEAAAAVDGERVGVTVTDESGAEVTLWEGDLLAGTFGLPSEALEEVGVCAAEEAISVFRVSGMSQEELAQQ